VSQLDQDYDIVRAEVFRKGLDAIAEEMAITLMRTSGSPVVTDGMDFSTSLLDEKGEQVGFSGYVAFHVSTSFLGVEAVSADHPIETLSAGDGFLINDPHTAGAIHQGDMAIVMPYFWRDEFVGWGHVNEHVLDVGGSGVSGFAPDARDCFSEALRFTGLHAIRDWELDREWAKFIGANVRVPGPVLNDLRSMIAAHNTGATRLSGLLDEFGMDEFRFYAKVNKQLSEDMVRRRIQALPDGVYVSDDYVEYDARGERLLYQLGLECTIDGDEATLRFHGDPQADCFINATKSVMLGQAMTTLLCQLIWDAPVNSGIWAPFHFDLGPVGTIVNPQPPAPTTQGHMEVGMRVNKLMSDVISQAASLSNDASLRQRAAGQPGNGPTSTTLAGIDRRSGQRTVMFPMSPPHCQGGGAQSVTDGHDTYGSQATLGTGVPAIEIEESTAPMMVLWRRIAENSGGAGYHTGGHGISMGMAIVGADELAGTAFNAVAELVPRGFAGGLPGGASAYCVYRNSNVAALLESGRLPLPGRLDGDLTHPPAKTGSLRVQEWDTFIFTSSGGGGLGDPLLRPPDAVAADVDNEFVSLAAALELFGVVLDDSGAPDIEATGARRLQMRSDRIGGATTREPTKTTTGGVPLTADLAVGVARDGSRWSCAHCAADLGPATDNFRDHSVCRIEDGATLFLHHEIQIRPRPAGEPQVEFRSHFCPQCATTLVVDVTLEGNDPVASAVLDANELTDS
jgi:N-methylhydantoinase B